MNSATEPTASTKTPRRAVHGTVRPLVLPSILGDSLAELNRLRDSITASMGIPVVRQAGEGVENCAREAGGGVARNETGEGDGR